MEKYNLQSDSNIQFILDNILNEMCAVETADSAESDDFSRLCWGRLKERSAGIGYAACALRECTGGVEYSVDGDQEATIAVNCARYEHDNKKTD